MVAGQESPPMELRRGLRNYWYPVALSRDVTGPPVSVRRLAEDLVIWRDECGDARVFSDRCPHRGTKLSVGDVVNGRLQCRYHGLLFDGDGRCRLVPTECREDGPAAGRLRAGVYPTEECGGFVYAYLGDVERFPPPGFIPEPELVEPVYLRHWHSDVFRGNWLLVRDNTPDPAHLPFLHGGYTACADGSFRLERIEGRYNPIFTPEYVTPLVTQRLLVTDTDDGITARREGEEHDELHWTLPNLAKIIVPMGPEMIVVLFQYEVPIDEHATQLFWCLTLRWEDDALRDDMQVALDETIWPGFEQAFPEDSWIIEAQGNLDDARSVEHLLPSDAAIARVRRLLLEAYERQQLKASASGSSGVGRAT